MRQKTYLSAILLVVLGVYALQAQTGIPATGGAATGNSGSVSYSVGQVVYSSSTGTDGNSIVQGVQQPYEISVETGLPEASEIDLIISAYPNPTIDFLTIKVGSNNLEDLHYQLIDNNGRLIESKIIISNETQVNMSEFAPASYFIRILTNKEEVKVFKIIKSH